MGLIWFLGGSASFFIFLWIIEIPQGKKRRANLQQMERDGTLDKNAKFKLQNQGLLPKRRK